MTSPSNEVLAAMLANVAQDVAEHKEALRAHRDEARESAEKADAGREALRASVEELKDRVGLVADLRRRHDKMHDLFYGENGGRGILGRMERAERWLALLILFAGLITGAALTAFIYGRVASMGVGP